MDLLIFLCQSESKQYMTFKWKKVKIQIKVIFVDFNIVINLAI